MISVTFQFGNQIVEVRVLGKDIYFAEVRSARAVFVPIERLRLSCSGIIKEFPDLENYSEEDMKREAIRRFKEKISKMKNEEEIANYVIKDLSNYGYVPKLYMKDGFRPKIL